MSKNKFKKDIQSRYKGRGNTWVKVIKGTKAYEIFDQKLSTLEDADEFKLHISREGYGWLRFSKVSGSENDPHENFELRYRGSKFDHIDCIISMPYNVSKEMPLLGNTPVKLQIETLPDSRKASKTSFVKKNPSLEENAESKQENNNNFGEEIRIIKEAALTTPSNIELENWYEFLKLNGLYEENV